MKKYLSIEEYFKIQNKENNNKYRYKYKYLLKLFFLSLIILSFGVIFKWTYDNYKVKKINKEIDININKTVNNREGILVNEPSNKNSNYYYYVTFPFYEVNFSSLLAKNKNTVGYIQVKNTIINYPVVQASDNNYYLKHSFDNKSNSAGWVFMDYRNQINELDDNTIIYGHHRKDGTMFGSLKNVLTSNWQNNRDNYIIYFSTLNENMLFQIFSIYTIKQESYYLITNFNNNIEKQKWIDTMKKRNITKIDTEVNINDKFLTLSTCKNRRGERIVVHAKLIKMQKIK